VLSRGFQCRQDYIPDVSAALAGSGLSRSWLCCEMRTQSTDAGNNSLGDIFNALASFTMLRRDGFRVARSIPPIKFTWNSPFSANASCVRPSSCRLILTFLANSRRIGFFFLESCLITLASKLKG